MVRINQLTTRGRAHIPESAIRITLSLSLKQFLSPDPQRMAAISNLEPRPAPVQQIGIKLALRHNAFDIALRGKISVIGTQP
jgi:hypothetical protein